jgi:L-ascorbate metabolism protein UlaG (beta-lactamase superfamily)
VKNGPAIYHTGDTDLFADMSLISKFQPITVMLTCIGDHFVMSPERAGEAVSLVRPALAIPMHYGTFPVLNGTPEAFEAAVKKRNVGTEVRKIEPHAVIEL